MDDIEHGAVGALAVSKVKVPGAIGIAGNDGVQDGAVLVGGLAGPGTEADGGDASTVQMALELAHQLEHDAVAGGLPQQAVEALVGGGPGGERFGRVTGGIDGGEGGFLGSKRFLELSEHGCIGALGGELDGLPFDAGDDFVDLAHVLDGGDGDDEAPTGRGGNQALEAEPGKGLSDGRAAHAKLGGEIGLDHKLTGEQAEVEDACAQRLVGALGKASVVRGGSGCGRRCGQSAVRHHCGCCASIDHVPAQYTACNTVKYSCSGAFLQVQ